MQFAHLSSRLFNTPLAIHPRKAEIVVASLADRLGITSICRSDGMAIKPQAWFDDDDDFSRKRSTHVDPGYDVMNGVAMLQISGTLVHKLGSLRPYSGMMGYDGIRQAYLTAHDDPEVKAIACIYDSGGGEVAGCSTCAATSLCIRFCRKAPILPPIGLRAPAIRSRSRAPAALARSASSACMSTGLKRWPRLD